MSAPSARALLAPLAVGLAVALVWTWSASTWLAVPWLVAGPSMEPTLRAGDRVLVDLWSYRQRLPRAGEVALVEPPGGPAMLKRIESVDPANDRLRVLGDNPRSSLDSRRFGPLPLASARGRVAWLLWPPARFGPPRPD